LRKLKVELNVVEDVPAFLGAEKSEFSKEIQTTFGRYIYKRITKEYI